jgi:CheY-like chemotaxis protein
MAAFHRGVRTTPTKTGTDRCGIRVLIVEDDLLHRMSLVAMMQDRGFDTEEAATGEEALTVMASKTTLHVAIVDLGLPDMDGRALVAAARAMRPDLKVVFATGYEASAVPEAEADPLSRYLPKPFNERHLARVFESFGWPMPPRLDSPPGDR